MAVHVNLKHQSGFARGFRELFDGSQILVAVAIEHNATASMPFSL